MELIIGAVIAVGLIVALAEDEDLSDYADRMEINRMADRSRARKAPGMRPRCRYIEAGWRPGR